MVSIFVSILALLLQANLLSMEDRNDRTERLTNLRVDIQIVLSGNYILQESLVLQNMVKIKKNCALCRVTDLFGASVGQADCEHTLLHPDLLYPCCSWWWSCALLV